MRSDPSLKNSAVTEIQSSIFDFQVVYVGDSAADETAITRLKGVAYTFRVINEDSMAITKTSANYRLEGETDTNRQIHRVCNYNFNFQALMEF